jgi:hypothetical protein
MLFPVANDAVPAAGHDWLTHSRNRLDARLTALLIHVCAGAMDDAQRDLAAYRADLTAHLEEAERRLIGGLAGIGERERVLERLEWKSRANDLRRIVQAVDRDMRPADASRLYDTISALRYTLQRHRRHENRLRLLAADGGLQCGTPREEAHDRP